MTVAADAANGTRQPISDPADPCKIEPLVQAQTPPKYYHSALRLFEHKV